MSKIFWRKNHEKRFSHLFSHCAWSLLCAPAASPAAPAATEAPAAAGRARRRKLPLRRTPAEETEYKVAMITDYGDITDQSFNQTTYEACKAFAEDNGIEFNYFKPAGDSTADRVAMIEKAVDEGYNVIVMPGYAAAAPSLRPLPSSPEVKFIALDVAKGDLLETAVANAGETYDYNPDNWDFEQYVDMSNVYCAIYQEELCGYMAGLRCCQARLQEPWLPRRYGSSCCYPYGYGFVQGC